jgi:hypothetical protein
LIIDGLASPESQRPRPLRPEDVSVLSAAYKEDLMHPERVIGYQALPHINFAWNFYFTHSR